MKTRRTLLSLAAIAIAVAACNATDVDAELIASENLAATAKPGHPTWGVVMGGIATPAPGIPNQWTMSDHADALACDLAELGARWARIDLGTTDNLPDLAPFKAFIAKAHGKSISVLAVVHAPNCSGSCPAGWADNYVAKLNGLIDHDLTGSQAPDAYEISNEPNVGGENGIDPQPFASLLNLVWQKVKLPHAARGQKPLILNGALLNTYLTDEKGYWNPFWDTLQKSEPPFDVFAVHPYDEGKYMADGKSGWRNRVISDLQAIRTKIQQLYPGTYKSSLPKLWATEMGWSAGGVSPADKNQADLLTYTDDTFANDLIEVAFWYDYRDDEPAAGSQHKMMGLRWSTEGAYRARPIYKTFASLMSASGNQDACYPKLANDCAPDPDGAADCYPRPDEDASKDKTTANCYYAGATRVAVAGRFYQYWKKNGGLAVFGYPIRRSTCTPNSDPNWQANHLAPYLFSQWFERQRMEYHPENGGTAYEVELGLLGYDRLSHLTGNTLEPNGKKVVTGAMCQSFQDAGHTICDDLLRYYNYDQAGAIASAPKSALKPLDLLGLPITPEFETTCPVTPPGVITGCNPPAAGSNTYMCPCRVQYTERARLEVHYAQFPDLMSPYHVQQGLLGNELAP